jgi:hypothetical protein
MRPSTQSVGCTPAAGRSTEELIRLSDLTLAEYLRYMARYGGAVNEEDEVLLFAGAHAQPNPYRNGVLRLGAGLAAGPLLDRADRFFGPRRRGYALWVREHGDQDLEELAVARDLHELERLPQLVLDHLPDFVPPPDGVKIVRALDERTREDYLRVVADAWGMGDLPSRVAAQVFFDPDSLDLPSVAAYVAYYDDKPLAAAMTLVAYSVALGCQAGAIRRPAPGQRLPPPGPPGERRGLAESCLWAALEFSMEHLGATLSLCQTSSQGAPVWFGLGYEQFTSYGRYLLPVPRGTAAQ